MQSEENTTSVCFQPLCSIIFENHVAKRKHMPDFTGSFPNKRVTLTYMNSNYTWNFLRSQISDFVV